MTLSVPPATVSRSELLVDGSDDRFRQFVHDMLAFSSRIQSVRAGFAAYLGLSPAGYSILIAIRHLQDKAEIGVAHIADHLHLSGAFVTIEIGKLVAFGLVDKRAASDDRRRVILKVTERGMKLLGSFRAVQSPVNDELFGSLSATEFGQLCHVINKLASSGDGALDLLSYLSGVEGKRA